MFETFILAVILMIICLLMCWKPVPIVGIPIALVTLFLSMSVFFQDETLPANPYFTLIIAVVAIGSILVNALKYNSK